MNIFYLPKNFPKEHKLYYIDKFEQWNQPKLIEDRYGNCKYEIIDPEIKDPKTVISDLNLLNHLAKNNKIYNHES